jgi:hypothetical protein
MKTLNLKSGKFAYTNYFSKNGVKFYSLPIKPNFGFDMEKQKELCIKDGVYVEFINGVYYLVINQ